VVIWSGNAGESHPRAPTDPCTNLSIHTAPAGRLRGTHPHLLCSYAHFILKVRPWRTWIYQQLSGAFSSCHFCG